MSIYDLSNGFFLPASQTWLGKVVVRAAPGAFSSHPNAATRQRPARGKACGARLRCKAFNEGREPDTVPSWEAVGDPLRPHAPHGASLGHDDSRQGTGASSMDLDSAHRDSGGTAVLDPVRRALGRLSRGLWGNGGVLEGRVEGGGFEVPAHWKAWTKDGRVLAQEKIERFLLQVQKINSLEPEMARLSNQELAAKTEEFRLRLGVQGGGVTLDSLLPEAFAVVREAAKRQLDMRHFDSQLIGGMILHEGKVAEMGTGEGKTLVATLPAYLNALEGKGVHIVTVNDYLVARDAEKMGRVFRALGLSVGKVVDHHSGPGNQAALGADITYVTSSSLAWLYLADNTSTAVTRPDQLMLTRPLHYAIVDEVDSVLIDSAISPLILSTPQATSPDFNGEEWRWSVKVLGKDAWAGRRQVPYENKRHEKFEAFVLWGEAWVQGKGYAEPHVLVNDAQKSAEFTPAGWEALVQQLNAMGYPFEGSGRPLRGGDLWTGDHPLGPFLRRLLRAHLFQLNRDYLVRGQRVLILDQLTGRSREMTRWSEGMHQAVEVKEGIPPGSFDVTAGSITYQVFFNFYKKLAGMTGTAGTEEVELEDMYRLAVETVPPNKASARTDHPMEVYMDAWTPRFLRSPWLHFDGRRAGGTSLAYRSNKEKRVVVLVQEALRRGQPVLVGTSSVEESQALDNLLRANGVHAKVLNALPKNVNKEAEIIAQAGMPRTNRDSGAGTSAVTVATSIAGRGTDVRLGGDPQGIMKIAMRDLYLKDLVGSREDGEVDECPLQGWPEDNKWAHLRNSLPLPVYEVLREGARHLLQRRFSEPQPPDPEAARARLEAAFTAVESHHTAFMRSLNRNWGGVFGQALEGRKGGLWGLLEGYCTANLAPARDGGSGAEGAEWALRRSALWCWVHLERECHLMAQEAVAAGGLRVICTSLGENVRFLNQFRGRSGRQGDPGETYVVLSAEQDILGPDMEGVLQSIYNVMGKAQMEVGTTVVDQAETMQLWEDAAGLAAAIKPFAIDLKLHQMEARFRDARDYTKKVDDVLQLVRQQVFDMRMWILKAHPSHIHAMLRSNIYDLAADMVSRHVNAASNPGNAESWRIGELLASTWPLVNGKLGSLEREGGAPDALVVKSGMIQLYGVKQSPASWGYVTPVVAEAAEKVRTTLSSGAAKDISRALGEGVWGDLTGLDLDLIQEQMVRTREGASKRVRDNNPQLQGRYQAEAMKLVDFLACVVYVAWLGERRRGLKAQLRTAFTGLPTFDAMVQDATNGQGQERGIDLETALQEWERMALLETLQQLWTRVMHASQDAYHATSLSYLSMLKPLDEYARALGANYWELLGEQRIRSIENLFAGPEMSQGPQKGAVQALEEAMEAAKRERTLDTPPAANSNPQSPSLPASGMANGAQPSAATPGPQEAVHMNGSNGVEAIRAGGPGFVGGGGEEVGGEVGDMDENTKFTPEMIAAEAARQKAEEEAKYGGRIRRWKGQRRQIEMNGSVVRVEGDGTVEVSQRRSEGKE